MTSTTPAGASHISMEDPQHIELEIVTADIENRLRTALFRMLRPALDQVADLTRRIEDLGTAVGRHDKVIYEVEEQREQIGQHRSFANILKEEVAKVAGQLYKLEFQSGSEIADIRSKCTDIDNRVEHQQAEIRQQTRELNRCWDELARLSEQQQRDKQNLTQSILTGTRRTDDAREECMIFIRELQMQRVELLEDLYGEGKGLTKLSSDLLALTKFTLGLPALETRVHEIIDRMTGLETSQKGVQEYVAGHRVDMARFAKSVDSKLEEMRNLFAQDSNALVAHHASLMKDIRRDYIDEMNANKTLRNEITKFQRTIDLFCKDISEGLKSESRRIDAIHREILLDMDEQKKRRKKDRAGVELELNDMRHQVAASDKTAKDVHMNVEFLSRIIGLVLEGERLSNAMLVQDFADRGAEKWLSIPSELHRRSQQPLTAEALEAQRNREAHGRKSCTTGDLVQIDWRKGVVSSQYMPGQVAYQGVAYERRDLMLLHHKLLQKAHSALTKGPDVGSNNVAAKSSADTGGMEYGFSSSIAAAAPATITTQPSARGGIAVGQGAKAFTKTVLDQYASAYSSAAGGRILSDNGGPGGGKLTTPDARSGSGGSNTKALEGAKVLGERTPTADSGVQGDLEDAAKYAGSQRSSTRQRPGSQGQPQAVGSRGSMFGSLGETAPPPPQRPASDEASRTARGSVLGRDSGVVRLPNINGDVSRVFGGGRAGSLTAR